MFLDILLNLFPAVTGSAVSFNSKLISKQIELTAFRKVTCHLSRVQGLRLLDCLLLEGGFECRPWETPSPLLSFVFSSFSYLRMLLSWGWFWLPWMILLCGFHVFFFLWSHHILQGMQYINKKRDTILLTMSDIKVCPVPHAVRWLSPPLGAGSAQPLQFL